MICDASESVEAKKYNEQFFRKQKLIDDGYIYTYFDGNQMAEL